MIKFAVRQLLSSIVLLLIGTGATFALLYSNTAGIARQLLGQSATQEQVDAKHIQLGLDQPILSQYVHWVERALHGDLGKSFYTGEPVSNILASRLPVTLSVVLISVAIMLVLSAIIGVTAAVKGGWVDRLLQTGGVVGGAIPNFVIAIVLVFSFAVAWRLFPATGYVKPEVSVAAWLSSITLPIVAVLISSLAGAALQFRGAMIDVLSEDFVRTLRARAIPERAIVFRHALRNAALPGLTTISLQTIGLMGGVVVIEKIFALPGIAAQLNNSTLQRDIPVVMGAVLFTIVVVVVINIVLNLVTGWVNPKERLS